MDLSDFIPYIASRLGVSASTLVFLFFCINQGAKVGSRLIPNDSVGALGTLRRLCAILGADPSSRLTSGVSIADVAQQTLHTQPVTDKVADATGVSVVESPGAIVQDTQTRAGG